MFLSLCQMAAFKQDVNISDMRSHSFVFNMFRIHQSEEAKVRMRRAARRVANSKNLTSRKQRSVQSEQFVCVSCIRLCVTLLTLSSVTQPYVGKDAYLEYLKIK